MASIAKVLEEIGANSSKRYSTTIDQLSKTNQNQIAEKAEIVAFLAPAEEEKKQDEKDSDEDTKKEA